MDEIEVINRIKKVLITFALVFIGTGFFIVILSIIAGDGDIEFIRMTVGAGLFIAIGFTALISIVYLGFYITHKISCASKRKIVIEKEYARELSKKYSPALISLIYDLNIDIYRDYTATILYLSTKKYVNIKENENNYDFEILKTDSSQLSKSESYVLDKIINKTKFNEDGFKNAIIEEALEKSLITNSEVRMLIKFLLYLVICAILLYIHMALPYIFMFLTIFYLALVGSQKINDIPYIRTNNGKRLAKELQAFKNYIDEYTLISEKEIDYIQILEEYIPYAISLGEANTIEKFIKHNEEYRNLIYDKKIDE